MKFFGGFSYFTIGQSFFTFSHFHGLQTISSLAVLLFSFSFAVAAAVLALMVSTMMTIRHQSAYTVVSLPPGPETSSASHSWPNVLLRHPQGLQR